MEISELIRKTFNDQKIEFEHTTHDPVFTSQEAADVRGVELRTGVKALICKRKKKDEFILILVPADQQVDLKKITALDGNRLHLATPKDVFEVTGCTPGSVPPFCHKTELKTYISNDVFENEIVNFNIGVHDQSAGIKSEDLKKLLPENTTYF
jgi:Ala-tRNA(Pro) deacylase